MSGRKQTRNLQHPVAIVSSQVYPFGNSMNANGDAVEEDADTFELRPRGKEKIRKNISRERLDEIVLLARDIKEGDTLNVLALQYCCSVADIKRVNNLINDRDFFALRSIKIPVKKFSVWTETQLSPKGKPPSQATLTQRSSDFHGSPQALETVTSNESVGSYLQEVDKDIEQIVKCTNGKRENLDEVVSALSPPQACFEADRQKAKRKDLYYGADWGIGWWTAVVIMLIVGIITPVFYLLYYEILVKADVSHHATMGSAFSQISTPSPQAQIGNGHRSDRVVEENHEDVHVHHQENVIQRHIT
ncbi:lysM and putative peptidoglycan-binding domain-containing protein 3 [Microcaecilia unicolor]|uniref:LysM and putative peptidoglycan-binding domain-containing protein 3 n=1 Tax=Microcaecilia unicolor TaxID=1415580 RepID=A0A6P7XDG4_9AMPH|nr:lysM and putative peptidoglycan-binding domain-containing protein 3 [Microcaecilia unicolor]XP_030048647.1 lysM and putative peptidoglycan-binding domain-containing protein 3 [Microcaecilia unicolor]XP_030048648.1 lysM and putative peptidoglycan-binding domain-containing protein 3 [Microcaecilia unicolor]XP_030048649.1 lysM and putative peptidoglycan-binding domain-containing protein 3 [Microcaecilia unicolor]XP_030048650.1 lysM and putative peptidoglycan-binding domain-containing protein 3 